jgi:hypothetical protein
MKDVLEIADKITDVVLAYRPQHKKKSRNVNERCALENQTSNGQDHRRL